MILLNIFNPFSLNEDPFTIFNAQENAYQFVGVDSDANDRTLRQRFSSNYFRLGEIGNSVQPDRSLQRRIVIANGNTSELLFSLTPIGSNASVVNDINPETQNIIAAINSVQFAPTEPPELNINEATLIDPSLFRITFESDPGLAEEDFRLVASEDLQEFNIDLSTQTTFSEVTEGVYQADITLTDSNDSFYFQIQIPE